MVHNTFVEKHDNLVIIVSVPNLIYIEKEIIILYLIQINFVLQSRSSRSNDSLSVLEELKIIRDNSNFDFNTLLKIASKTEQFVLKT